MISFSDDLNALQPGIDISDWFVVELAGLSTSQFYKLAENGETAKIPNPLLYTPIFFPVLLIIFGVFPLVSTLKYYS